MKGLQRKKMDSNKYVEAIQAAGHLLWLDDEGEVDMFAMSYECHNGPMCELCSDAWCVQCQPTVDQCSAAAIASTCESVGDAKALLPMTPNA